MILTQIELIVVILYVMLCLLCYVVCCVMLFIVFFYCLFHSAIFVLLCFYLFQISHLKECLWQWHDIVGAEHNWEDGGQNRGRYIGDSKKEWIQIKVWIHHFCQRQRRRKSSSSQSVVCITYLSTTILWVSFQFSSSPSVPMSGFNLCRLTPATFVPLQTGTKHASEPSASTCIHYFIQYANLFPCSLACQTFHEFSPLVSPCSPRIQPLKLLAWIPSLSAIRNRKRAESKLVPLPMTRCLGRPLSFQVTNVSTSTVEECWC